jgi:WD40 repeat protein
MTARSDAARARTDEPLIGRRFGGFVLQELVGRGGQGLLFRAEQPALGRVAMVKVLDARGRASEGAIARFLREARLASMLDHPYAAHVYAADAEPDGLLWIAMELVRGTPLGELIRTRGPLPLARFVPFFERLCQVVQTAHEQGLVHRDIKPANVMVVARAGCLLPKLLDFGVAKLEGERAEASEAGLLGSPAYMPPEQWIDPGRADAATDQYQLAILGWEALVGRRPFHADSLPALAAAHARAPAPPLPRPLPAELDAVFARALAKQSTDRFESVLAFAVALRTAAGAPGAAAMPQLDEPLRDAVIRLAPQPVADAVAALEAAVDAPAAWTAIGGILAAATRWLGILALCGSARLGAPIGAAARAQLERLRDDRLDDASWLALASELCRPFADRRDAFPIPELVALLVAEDGRDRDPFAPLFAVRASARATSGEAEEALAEYLAAAIRELATALRAIAFTHDYPLAVARGDGLELWSGAARSSRARLALSGAALEDGTVVLLSTDGVPVLELTPLAQVAPPSPGLAREMFLLDGGGRRGARLVAYPTCYERHDDGPRTWLAQRGLLSDGARSALDEVELRPPWRGLATLQADDAALFVGREREVESAINRLRPQPWLAVVGPSGAGKSSFVQAGVLAGLPPRWSKITVRPGASPWAALRARLGRDGIAVGDGGDPDELGRRLRDAGPIVLVVDQLEEIFTLCIDADERRRYAAALVRTALDADDDVRLIVTLRDDFLVQLARLPGFRDRLASGMQILTTPARPDLIRILVEPARRTGYGFDDPALPAEMIDAVAEVPGALALLSYTATRLWELRDRRCRHLSRRAYDALGGVGGALARHAEAMLAELTAAEQRLVREAFRHLVTGAGTRVTLSRVEIVQLLGGGAVAERVVERLVAARLLQASDGDASGERIEVIHEALLSAWPRLVQWRREDAEGARLRDELRAAARRWHERGRPGGLLWRDDALVEYRLWRSRHPGGLTDAEASFAAASLSEVERGKRRRRYAAGAVIAIAIGFAVLQLIARKDAQAQHARAEDRLAANYQEHARQLYLDGDPARAFAYAVEARRLGARGSEIEYLIERMLGTLSREQVVLDAGGRVQSLIETADGRLIAASADGTARIWDGSGRVLGRCGPHDMAVYHADASADGDTVVTASWDGTARLWDGHTCAPRATLAGHTGRVFWAGFRADGRRVFTTGTDRTARIWDASTGAPLLTLPFDAPLYVAGFSHDGTRFAAAAAEPPGGARLWAMPGGEVIADLRYGPMESLAFDPSGGRLLLAGTDRTARVIDARTGGLIRALDHPHGIATAVWDPSGRRIVTGDEAGAIRIWDVETGHLMHQTAAHAGRVSSLAFNADGRRLASGGMDGRAIVWDVETATPVVRVNGQADAITAAIFIDRDRRLATASSDHTVRLWSLEAPDATPLAPATAFASFDATGTVVVAASRGEVGLWDGATGSKRCALDHSDEVAAAEVSPDAALVATGDVRGRVRIWDARSCARRFDLQAHAGAVRTVGFASDGSRVVTGGADGIAKLWDASTGAAVGAISTGAPIASAGFSPDGRTLFVMPDHDYTTSAAPSAGLLFDARTLARTATLPHARPLLRLAFTPDGHVLTMSRDGTAVLWRADGGAVTRIVAPAGSWFDADVDRDGRRVVTCGQDPAASVWDARTGTRIGTLVRHVGYVLSCRFSADGQFIVTASTDGTAKMWDVATLAPIESFTLSGEPDPMLGPAARFHPRERQLLTWTRDGELRLWRLGPESVDERAIDLVRRCRIAWRVDAGILVPASLDRAGCYARE